MLPCLFSACYRGWNRGSVLGVQTEMSLLCLLLRTQKKRAIDKSHTKHDAWIFSEPERHSAKRSCRRISSWTLHPRCICVAENFVHLYRSFRAMSSRFILHLQQMPLCRVTYIHLIYTICCSKAQQWQRSRTRIWTHDLINSPLT